MKRRVYLATAAVALGGCSALSDSETADDDPEDDDDTDTDTGTDDDTETDTGTDDDEEEEESVDEETGTFDDFEDLSEWTVMAGSLTADEDRVYTGSQSGLLEPGEENRAMIKREFDSPRDLSNEWPALALATDTDINVIVQLSDADENRYILRTPVTSGTPFAPHDLGVYDAVGEPDLSEVEHIKISFLAGEDRDVRVWCDDLHFVSRPETGKVMLQFDDGYATTSEYGLPVLEEYDYPATAFVNTDYVGGEARMDLEDLESLSDAGWTVASQSATGDLTQFDAGEQESEIESAKDWLTDNGFEDGADYFAYPLGRFDETTLEHVEDNHELAFAGGYTVHGNITNPHRIPRAVHPDADEARRLLNATAAMRGITTLTYREFDSASYRAFQETMAHLSELESAGEIDVVLPEEIASDHLHDH